MGKYTADNGMTFTDEDIDHWCEYYDKGEFPPGEHTVGEAVAGRPPLSPKRKGVLESTETATNIIAEFKVAPDDSDGVSSQK